MAAPTPDDIETAAKALRDGKLVVFPTETVYGLGANALDPEAVARIFVAKGRPGDNPLIVHVADADAAKTLVAAWPEVATLLTKAFWPGPLTLVLPKKAQVPDITTGGLDSVAVRAPAHPLAQALLEAAGVPVAAPSANRSGRPSPTRMTDARADLGDAVTVYLDGGPTKIGLESTVVDLRGAPAILRPGGVPRDAIEAIVGPLAAPPGAGPVRSPGMKYRHYAPRARVRLIATDALMAEKVQEAAKGHRVAVVASKENAPASTDVVVPGGRDDAAAWGHQIFAILRDLDAAGYDVVLVEAPPEGAAWEAVADRLRRAAEGTPDPVGP